MFLTAHPRLTPQFACIEALLVCLGLSANHFGAAIAVCVVSVIGRK